MTGGAGLTRRLVLCELRSPRGIGRGLVVGHKPLLLDKVYLRYIVSCWI